MNVLEIILCILAIGALVPALVLLAEVLAALPPYGARPLPPGRRPTVAVLVPAHDEELVIADTLSAIASQLGAGDRLLVVADNCSDDTAQIAATAGAEVIRRDDPVRRGKGYALDFGLRHLERKPPEVVVVIDADCTPTPGTIERLTRVCCKSNRPVQGLDLMLSPQGAGLGLRVGEFAWRVKNHVRPLGLLRLGLPCQLMGTGMAFPWNCVCDLRLAGDNIVEDLIMGIDLARSGHAPLFCPEAAVESHFPSNPAAIRRQRVRWEHGHLLTILRVVPAVVLTALMRGNAGLLAMALDLSVPPLSFMFLALIVVLGCSGAFVVAAGSALPLWLAGVALTVFGVAVFIAWLRYGRETLSFRDLAYAPAYALRKLPVYLGFAVRRQTEWIRSRREGE